VNAGATRVYCYPVSRNSTYVPLLFDGIEDRYERIYREDGSLDDAIAEIDAGRAVVVHIHWEEFVFRDCMTDAEADAAAATFARQIGALRERNAPIVWTVHNELPHLIGFHDRFLATRVLLARAADAILVHNATSIDVLATQVDLDRAKVSLLPHPSYLDRFESEATLLDGLDEPHERRIQSFGWIRLQKGFGEMIEMLSPSYLRSRGASIRISGEGAEATAVIARVADRTDVEWDIRHVPDAEVPRLLRSAACVVLPYERVLTSGVALLAMSVGALLVAVDIPQLRELLPVENRRFLYPRGDGAALRRAIDDALGLSAFDRRRRIDANLAIARDVRPRAIARRLADVYDRVTARRFGTGAIPHR
jgi:beta-1,4-mannosyltransferase